MFISYMQHFSYIAALKQYIMKKFTQLLLLSIMVFSCSTPEDESFEKTNTSPDDEIIGKWQRYKEVFFMDNGNVEESFSSACNLQGSIQFYSNGSAVGVYYHINQNGICELETNYSEYLYWSKVGVNEYLLTSKIEGQPEETEILKIAFPSSEKMIWLEDDAWGIHDSETFTGSEEYFNRL